MPFCWLLGDSFKMKNRHIFGIFSLWEYRVGGVKFQKTYSKSATNRILWTSLVHLIVKGLVWHWKFLLYQYSAFGALPKKKEIVSKLTLNIHFATVLSRVCLPVLQMLWQSKRHLNHFIQKSNESGFVLLSQFHVRGTNFLDDKAGILSVCFCLPDPLRSKNILSPTKGCKEKDLQLGPFFSQEKQKKKKKRG